MHYIGCNYPQEIIVKQLFHLVYPMIPITLFQMALHILFTLVLSSTQKIRASFVKRLPDISSSYRSRWTCYKDDCHVPLLWLQNYVLMQCNVSSWERGGSYAPAYNNPCDWKCRIWVVLQTKVGSFSYGSQNRSTF